MDKYEYNLKLEEIDKLVDQGDYKEAASLADTIDWRRVRNVRTLCLISEIYEVSGRLEDSKSLLIRAYRKSPVGRNVLYRLVEVTTALKQYDEALEYYTEYVQAAPHDNNRYILKFMIYRGRGSSVEELITILEEYLGQEYTEKWAYELAKLYQQAGQMQKCFAACDDLILWFRSGKYVMKALELKKRYATLTPKQQQIYEDCLQEEAQQDYLDEPEEEETVVQGVDSMSGEVIAATIMAETEKSIAGEIAARKAEMDKEVEQVEAAYGVKREESASAVSSDTKEMDSLNLLREGTEAPEQADGKDLKIELAKSMRSIIAGVVKRVEDHEDDIPAGVESNMQNIQKLSAPEQETANIGQLSIDDILLSMGEKGKKIAAEAMQAQKQMEEERKASVWPAQEPEKEAVEEEPVQKKGQSITEAATDALTEDQKEALRYTNHPEKLLRNKSALPTYQEEEDDLGKTRRIVNTKEELAEAARKEILAEKTIRIPTEEIHQKFNEPSVTETAEAKAPETEEISTEAPVSEQTAEPAPEYEEITLEEAEASFGAEELPEEESELPNMDMEEEPDAYAEDGYEPEYEDAYGEYEEDYLKIPQHLRRLFSGFTEIESLEDQIANAIIQAQSKGDDRTSRTGNILIFGAHGSGKTTLAMNLAKAIAQDKGSQSMKMAKIYAADLNRKDIAATIAKIAGGTLIIEEAGDLEPNTVEQLTTAMEFRTDGLIIILEDEQQYVHELLMRHPRFTMKFTAQIYIPTYTAEELAMFGQIYANAQDYVIGEEGLEALYEKISSASASGTEITIADVIAMVAKAIQHSNKFFRKMSMGKKRYDENDYIILFAKDFR